MKQLRNFWKLVLHNNIKASMFDSFSINSWTHFFGKIVHTQWQINLGMFFYWFFKFKIGSSSYLFFVQFWCQYVDQLFILSFRMLFANSHRIYFLAERPYSAWVLASERAVETGKREIINIMYSLSLESDVTFYRISWSLIC